MRATNKIIVDAFAGGGGASLGISMATGRDVDVAINHDARALAMHRANHPLTTHYACDIYEVDPREACGGREVGLAWFSPDCTDHSKAKGGAPTRDVRSRSLAWVVRQWAGQVRPDVIMLENVEEFTKWGPLAAQRDKETGRVKRVDGMIAFPGDRTPLEEQRRCRNPKKARKTFNRFVGSLRDMGYVVEWKELRAHHFGAPTIRKRLFLIARCDGKAIVWPEKTHGPKTAKPYRTAAECIDWSVPMCSIFATKDEAKEWGKEHGRRSPRRPLAEKTMNRIRRGVIKYVVENPEPFIVGVGGRMGQTAERPVSQPYQTTTAKADAAVVTPFLVPRYGERPGQAPRSLSVEDPHPVIVPTGNGGTLVAPWLVRHYGGMTGKDLREPLPTILSKGAQDQLAAIHIQKQYGTATGSDAGEPLHSVTAGGLNHGVVAAHIQRDFGKSVGQDAGDPLGTVTPGGGGKAAIVASFLSKYYGEGTGSPLDEPVGSLTTKDRMGLVTVMLQGEPYVIVDIFMRMLTPAELYRAQGFAESYRIVDGIDGEDNIVRFTQTEQVRMVGNSVSPQCAEALVAANVPALSVMVAA